jgi:hypothetical protein
MATRELGILLGHAALTPEQVDVIDRRLDAVHPIRLREALLNERALLLTDLQYFEENLPDKQIPAYSAYGGRLKALEQAFLLRIMGQAAMAIEDDSREASAILARVFDEAEHSPDNFYVTRHRMLGPATFRFSVFKHRERVQLARLGMRVDRYFREHGQLPAALDQLKDDAMAEIPICSFSGLPPFLQPVGKSGFRVYMPGSNRKGEGGGMRPDMEEGASAFKVIYQPRPSEP